MQGTVPWAAGRSLQYRFRAGQCTIARAPMWSIRIIRSTAMLVSDEQYPDKSDINDLFDYPTLREIAAFLERRDS